MFNATLNGFLSWSQSLAYLLVWYHVQILGLKNENIPFMYIIFMYNLYNIREHFYCTGQ